MKIALVGTTASCVLGFRKELIKALVERGDQVYALAIDYDHDTREAVKEIGAVPIDYYLSRSGLNPFSEIVNTYRLARILRSIGPEVVFLYFSKPVIFGAFASVIAGVKRRIGMLEGLGYLFTDQPSGVGMKVGLIKMIQVGLYKLAIPLLEKIIFLNADDKRDLIDRHNVKSRESIVLGGIGVNLNDYPYSKPEISPLSFIFVGRLLVEKGVREYIAAARLVKLEYPQTKFYLLGGGDESNPGCLTRDELVTLQNSELMICPGNVDDVRGWIQKASVFVLPSYREGVPRSTQEAMAMGRAIITTDVPGCRDTVDEGVNGFLVPPWSAAALAEKMLFFVKNPSAAESMGIASHILATQKYDATKVNAKLLSLM